MFQSDIASVFWTMLRYGPIQWKNHASIGIMGLQISQGEYTLF